MNDTILIQQIYPDTQGVKLFDLTRERHEKYCKDWDMDYQLVIDDPAPHLDKFKGNWAKVELIRQAVEKSYKNIIWLDADTIIYDLEEDLRQAVVCEKIGACWQRIPQLPQGHWNVGALYLHNSINTRDFIDEWIALYPPPDDGWLEQGIFNRLGKETGTVVTISDKWNATIDVSVVPDTVVLGFHGQGNPVFRYNIMKQALEQINPVKKAKKQRVKA